MKTLKLWYNSENTNPFFPVAEVDVFRTNLKSDNFLQIKNKKALINKDTDELISVVGIKYKPILNKDIADKADEAITKNFPEYGRFFTKDIVFKTGARYKRVYTFPEVNYDITQKAFEDEKTKDTINPSIAFTNSYDGGSGFIIEFGAYRVVCSNGLVVGKRLFNFVRPHIQNPIKIFADGFSELQKAIIAFSDQTKLWSKWVEEIVTTKEKEDILKEMDLGKKNEEKVKADMPTNSALSRWVLFNIYTTLITHKITKEQRRIQLNNRLHKAIYSRWS